MRVDPFTAGHAVNSRCHTMCMTALMTLSTRVLIAGLPLATLAGCSERTGGVFTSEAGTVLLVASPQSYGDQAQVKGELVATKGGCVGVSIEGNTIPVVWPAGTRFDDAHGVVVPDVGTFALGGKVSGAGGYYHFDSAEMVGLEQSTLEDCESDNEYDEYANVYFED